MKIDRKTIRLLAAHAEIDPRTVERAVEQGIDSLRIERDKERLRAAAKELKVVLPP